MKKTWNPESGLTLIELMIGVGILAIIGYAASHFFARVTQSDAELSAKAKAQSELTLLTGFLEKDLKFREMDKLTDLCTASQCQNLSIERLAPGGGSYKVTYASTCAPLPQNSIYKDLKFDSTALDKIDSQCIKALNCAAGLFPQLTITVSNASAGAAIAPYPPKTPVYDRRTAYGLAGAALCASKTVTTGSGATTVNQNRIILEGAFVGSNKTIRIERKETVFSSNNMAKIQMLPN